MGPAGPWYEKKKKQHRRENNDKILYMLFLEGQTLDDEHDDPYL